MVSQTECFLACPCPAFCPLMLWVFCRERSVVTYLISKMWHDLPKPCEDNSKFYVYGSVHCRSILIIVQRDATQSSLFIILQVHSTCFGCQPHPSSVHKTVTTASGTGHIFLCSYLPPMWPSLAMLEGGSCITTGGCSYSFVYSWWWVWLTPETHRLNLQNNK